MNTKKKISLEEVAIHSVAPFSLFDENGNVLIYKGIAFTPTLLSMLSMQELYYIPTHKNHSQNNDLDKRRISKISKETADFLINVTQDIVTAAEKGHRPPLKACLIAKDKIISEVRGNIDKIRDIGQLRVDLDNYNITHGINVATISTALGLRLDLSKENLQMLVIGALLHDIGKAKLPKEIINKPDKLTMKEFQLIKLHPKLGYQIIKNEYGLPNKVALIAMDHHEYYDGSGYNRNLQGEEINTLAQIVALADVFDAAASNKVYAPAKSSGRIVKELLKNGKKYNPRFLYTLIHMVNYNTGKLDQKTSMA